MLELWSRISSCLHGFSHPQRTHAAVGGFVQCSEMYLALKTLTTKHKPKPQMIVSLDPSNLRCGFRRLYSFPDGITELDGSGKGKSWNFSSWLSVPEPTFPAVSWFIVSLPICWMLVNAWCAPNHVAPEKWWQEQKVMFISWHISLFHTVHDSLFTLNDLPTALQCKTQSPEQKLACSRKFWQWWCFKTCILIKPGLAFGHTCYWMLWRHCCLLLVLLMFVSPNLVPHPL